MNRLSSLESIDRLNDLIERTMEVSFSSARSLVTHIADEAGRAGIIGIDKGGDHFKRLALLRVFNSYGTALNAALNPALVPAATKDTFNKLAEAAASTLNRVLRFAEAGNFLQLSEERLNEAHNLERQFKNGILPLQMPEAAGQVLNTNYLAMDSLINAVFEKSVTSGLEPARLRRVVFLGEANAAATSLNDLRIRLNIKGAIEGLEISIPKEAAALLDNVIWSSREAPSISHAERANFDRTEKLRAEISRGDYKTLGGTRGSKPATRPRTARMTASTETPEAT